MFLYIWIDILEQVDQPLEGEHPPAMDRAKLQE